MREITVVTRHRNCCVMISFLSGKASSGETGYLQWRKSALLLAAVVQIALAGKSNSSSCIYSRRHSTALERQDNTEPKQTTVITCGVEVRQPW